MTGSDPEAIFKAAESAYEKQEFAQAEKYLEDLLKRFPRNYAANELMALALTGEGKDAAANPYFETAVKSAPSSAEARANLAANLARLGRNTRAEGEFAGALKLDPANYDLNHNFGEFYIALGKIAAAIPHLREAQKVAPNSYSNGYDLALALMETGALPEAEGQVQNLMKVQDTAELHGLLGDIYEKEGRFIPAANEFQQAAHLDPSESNLFNWGAELIRHQSPEPALQVFSRGIELYPQSWKLRAGLGVAFYMLSYKDRAVEALCRAIDIDASNSIPYFFLARIYNNSPAQAEEVAKRFEQYVRSQPRNAWARYYYALSLWKSARAETNATNLAKVENLLHSAVALDPNFADAHLQLGILYSEQGRNSQAIPEFERAIKLNASLADAHYRLGQVLMKEGDKERGKKELEISTQLHQQQVAEQDEETSQIQKFVFTEPKAPGSQH